MALVNAVLASARATGLRRVWSMSPAENAAGLRLQRKCGFRAMKAISLETELEIDLAVPPRCCARCHMTAGHSKLRACRR